MGAKNKRIILTLLLVVSGVGITYYYYVPNTKTYSPDIMTMSDKFGILKTYPTKPGGREWFIDMNNPTKDPGFKVGSNITRQLDGSWQISGRVDNGSYVGEVRMGININGTVSWVKEIWHTGGYTDKRAEGQVTNSINGRWIGWKVVVYNMNNDTAVKMESYLDNKANNQWIKVTDLTDNGGWYANSPDPVFYGAHCGKAKDYIITKGGPLAIFRSDNMTWNFKDLSVREIQPPS